MRKYLVLTCVLLIASGAWAAQNWWTNNTGDGLWTTAGNWNQNRVPTIGDSVRTGKNYSTGNEGTPAVLTGTGIALNLFMGQVTDISPTYVNINGGTLDVYTEAKIGNNSGSPVATLMIENGGVANFGTNCKVGQLGGGTGYLVMNNGTLATGYYGSGIPGGPALNAGELKLGVQDTTAYGEGNVSNGSLITVNQLMNIGDFGTGKLYLDDSDIDINLNFSGSGGRALLGNTATGDGYLELNNGSSLTTDADAQIGQGGKGELVVNASSVNIGTEIFVGNAAGSVGTFTMDNGSTLTAGDRLKVGNEGTGTMTVLGNSQINLTNNLIVGDESGSSGILNLKDGDIFAGGLEIGDDGGDGLIDIEVGIITIDQSDMNDTDWSAFKGKVLGYRTAGLITGYGMTGNVALDVDDGIKQMQIYVPEPATIALLGMGAAALVRRKRK